MQVTLEEKIHNVMSDVLNWRRTMHKNPELSFEEYWTSAYIEEQLQAIGQIEIVRPTETSVLGIIKGGKPGKKIGLRADIDALPIKEERQDIDFISENDGVMHACGHDGHASILLGAAKVLVEEKDELHGEIYLIFQHAEETPPGGAVEMVDTGLFDDLAFIYGQHLFTPIPSGKIGLLNGPVTANSDSFDVTIKGRGGHASQPENSIDPVMIGAQIISQLQTLVSRVTSPLDSLVISTTNFHAGSAKNIIPDTAELAGSVRSIAPETRVMAEETIGKIVKNICDVYGAGYDYAYTRGYSSVVNDDEKTDQVRAIATEHFQEDVFEFPLAMGGEDFSAFSELVPSTYAFIGVGNVDKDMDYPHHHPKFGMDEEAFSTGVQMFVAVALGMTREYKD
ncbi:MAG: amidohydrolase [Alkalibacterium sp.]|nr:amidohydrolase [Alkalibacterium sp.]